MKVASSLNSLSLSLSCNLQNMPLGLAEKLITFVITRPSPLLILSIINALIAVVVVCQIMKTKIKTRDQIVNDLLSMSCVPYGCLLEHIHSFVSDTFTPLKISFHKNNLSMQYSAFKTTLVCNLLKNQVHCECNPRAYGLMNALHTHMLAFPDSPSITRLLLQHSFTIYVLEATIMFQNPLFDKNINFRYQFRDSINLFLKT